PGPFAQFERRQVVGYGPGNGIGLIDAQIFSNPPGQLIQHVTDGPFGGSLRVLRLDECALQQIQFGRQSHCYAGVVLAEQELI
ncbi:hypothetical protein KK473_28155, partial [Klebsiella pneumoniae]|nr:hypothetical protein [Klebsiella pneumoniae]